MTMMMMYRIRDGDQSAASIPRLTVQQLLYVDIGLRVSTFQTT